MKLFALAFSAVVGLAAAQLEMLSEVPQCALECFTGTVMQTDCALTDFYCQCGKNAKFITEKTTACLCTSECTTSDLAKVYSITNQLCSKTLEDHGETYDVPPMPSSGLCHAEEAPAAAAGNSTGTASTGSNSTSSSTSSPKASTSSFEGAASNFGVSIAAIAAGGLALMAI